MGKPQNPNFLEHGIYTTNRPDFYDVRVWRTIDGQQFQRRRNSVQGIMKARKIRRELEDELAKFELKKKGGDIPFNEALVRGEFHEDLKNNSVATKKNVLKYLRQVFEYHLLEFGRIKVNPATGIYFKNDEKRKYPKVMQLKRLRSY